MPTNGAKNHEKACLKRKECPVCKNYFLGRGITCGHGCANTYFRSNENHPNWKDDNYRSTCFHYHEKECVVCAEMNIIEVHHLDENTANNAPDNLIPLCPTHHQYWHSRFKPIVEPAIRGYVERWKRIRDIYKELPQ